MRHKLNESSRLAGSNYAGLELKIVYLPIDDLKPPPIATRKVSRAHLKRIGRSLKAYGFLVPATIYGDNVLASGAARVEAARAIGMTSVPVIRLEHLTEEQARGFALADNKLSEGGQWDLEGLTQEFGALAQLAPNFDQNLTFFATAERDILFSRHRTSELVGERRPNNGGLPAVSQPGDGWNCGRHFLYCGDATDPRSFEIALMGQKVRLLLSDLPYNVKIADNVSGKGRHKHGDFAMASGEFSRPDFTAFLSKPISAALPYLVNGALAYLFMDHRHWVELMTAAEGCGLHYLNMLVWEKTNPGQGSHYRSAHELIGLFKHGRAPHMNNVMLGRYGRSRSNVLHYDGMNGFSMERDEALAMHSTVKPLAMIADLILDSTEPGNVVLDPFGGSGTTLIAAEKMGRTARLIEIDPAYVDVTVRRFEEATGIEATHHETGKAFRQMGYERNQGGDK